MKIKDMCVLIKCASSLCDMRCAYCFYRDEAEHREAPARGLMTEETAELLITRALGHAERSCSFIFQGGEPTLSGLDFFRFFVNTVKEKNSRGLKIFYSVQTNGQRIDKAWAEFFRENNFLVGLSLDGNREQHDLLRGEGSHKKVMRAIETLKSCGTEFNILTVVTSRTAKNPEAVYNFFKKNGLFFQQYIPCLDKISGESSLSAGEYGHFLSRLFKLWARDAVGEKPVSIRYFDELVLLLLGKPVGSCGMSGLCGVQYVAESNGDIYPCDFYCMDEYLLGNIFNSDFETLDARRKELKFIEASAPVTQMCRECPYYKLCRGGCRRERDRFDGGDLGQNRLCEAYRIFFSECLGELIALAGRFSGKQA